MRRRPSRLPVRGVRPRSRAEYRRVRRLLGNGAHSGQAVATAQYKRPTARLATTAATTTRMRSLRARVARVACRCRLAGTACSLRPMSHAITARPTVTRPTTAAPSCTASSGPYCGDGKKIRKSRATTARHRAYSPERQRLRLRLPAAPLTAETASATVRNNVTWALPRTPAPTYLQQQLHPGTALRRQEDPSRRGLRRRAHR